MYIYIYIYIYISNVFYNIGVLKNLQNSKGSTYAGVAFFIKFQPRDLQLY